MSERDILLSVIVPVYNVEPYLAKTLDSLLAAAPDGPMEIIAVDDGSADRSLEILREYEVKTDTVRVIRRENGGVSRARNTGIEAARGKYITFADGDDTVLPGFFAAAIAEMEEHGFDLVQGNIRYIGDDDKVRMVAPGSPRMESADPAELREWFFGQSETLTFNSVAKVYRRSAVGDVRFEPGIRIAEDLQFVFDLLRKNPRVLILDTDAYDYIERHSSVTHTQYVENGWDAIKVLERCEGEETFFRFRKQIRKLKTNVLVKIYNIATLSGKDAEPALEEIRKFNLTEIREMMTRKEWAKLMMLQRCRGVYDCLLRAQKA